MMRRIAFVLSVGALMATLLVVIAAPAMARNRNDNNNNNHVRHFNDNGVIFVNDNDDDDFEDFFDNDFNDRRFFFDDFNGFENDFEQDAESGDVDLSFETSNTGDNSNVCAPALQFGNTGNLQNEQGFTSIGDGFFDFDGFDNGFFDNGDVDFEGSTATFEPSLDTTCEQSVQQSSAASSD